MSQWEAKWTLAQSLTGGGQGEAALVRPRGAEGPIRFLKILKDNSQERRDRMRREIGCYATLHHPRIPTLIDSNVEAFDQPGVIPYLVSEFVGGHHLEDHLRTRRYLPTSEAFDIVFKLLDTVAYIHAQETVHRDIKPSNIVLRDDQPAEPVLVDFGMSFYEGEDRLTDRGQEIGNRFLRLPEFSASSKNKRDPRSDVTLTAGILLYLLTGRSPRDLRDYNGQAPHQTPEAREALAQHADVDLLALLDIFDRAFDPIIHARWDSAEALSAALGTIKLGTTQMPADEPRDVMASKLKEIMARHDELRLQKRRVLLQEAFANVRQGINALADEIGGLVPIQGGYTLDAKAGKSSSELGLIKASDNTGYRPICSIELQGSDIVLSFDDVPFYRGTSEDFHADAERLISLAQEAFLKGLRSRIAG